MITLKHDLPPPISDPNDLLRSGNCISFQWYIGFSVVVHNHPIFVPAPSTSLWTNSKASISRQRLLSIALSLGSKEIGDGAHSGSIDQAD